MENNVCPNCGNPVPENAKFCTSCGEKIVPAEQAPAVNETPAPNSEPTPNAAPAPNPEPTPNTAPSSNSEPTPNTAPASNSQTFANASAAPNYGFNPNPAPAYKEAPPAPPAYIPVPEEEAPGKDSPYQPISTWGYVGINFIMAVPILNLVMLIVWACGGCRKVNKRNMARGIFLTMLISLVVGIIITILGLTVFRNIYYEIMENLPYYGFDFYY